jgi:hypothetical protein
MNKVCEERARKTKKRVQMVDTPRANIFMLTVQRKWGCRDGVGKAGAGVGRLDEVESKWRTENEFKTLRVKWMCLRRGDRNQRIVTGDVC